MNPPTEMGEVYVVADAAGLVKVGYSTNTKQRMGNISYWCPADRKPIRLIAVRRLEDRMARVVEKVAHELLGPPVPVMNSAPYEWFAVDPDFAVREVDRAIRAARKHWPRRHGVKIREAVARINAEIAPRKVTAGWLYANVK